MAEFDLVVRGGTVIDGLGGLPCATDVAITDGRIVAVGDFGSAGNEEIDAKGLVVAPGFIDLHTHYDAQIFWDPILSPASQHGITTVIGGNCGLTLAPVTTADQDFLTRLFAQVEAIPEATLQAGVPYDWQTFPEMLDRIEDIELGPNIGLLVGHSALRRSVMGEAASEREATDQEVEAMCGLLDEALVAGGLGFSTANVSTQVDGDGRPTPPNFATRDEFVALAGTCARHPGTTLEFIPNSFLAGFSDEERASFSELLESGFIDTFRYFHPGGPGHYTWWSYRGGARQRNVGWRLDYFGVSAALIDRVASTAILKDVLGSDHCPIELVMK